MEKHELIQLIKNTSLRNGIVQDWLAVLHEDLYSKEPNIEHAKESFQMIEYWVGQSERILADNLKALDMSGNKVE